MILEEGINVLDQQDIATFINIKQAQDRLKILVLKELMQ